MFEKMIEKSKAAQEELQQIEEKIKIKIKEQEEGKEIDTSDLTNINSRTIRPTTRLRKSEEEMKLSTENPLEQKIIDTITDIFK